jgi:alkylation response protein AidB-like acyl-CoA dehydrogenase
VTTVDEFRIGAAEWLRDHRSRAPRDYGAICPPDLIGDAIAWQRSINDAGYAGIHWPVEHGGRGFTPEHNAAWQYECALACSGGRYSNWGILMARTDPDVAKHKGISFFLLPMDLAGIEIRPLRQMTGDAEFDEVFFTDVRLPADHLLGPLHDGWNVGMAVLTNERGHIGTSIIGLERRLEAVARLADGRQLTPTARDVLARLMSTVSAYKAMARRQGPIASVAASLMKLGITEMMFGSAVLRATVAGAEAMLDGPESMGVLAAPGGRIAGGTSQVQRNIIGERLLGLPPEPKPPGA